MIRRGIGVQSFVAAGGAGTDADAQAFITAAAITDATQQSAINTLVTSLKTYGVWTKMKAIYPFVGGTASAHKFNLRNPADTDAAFRLVFSGGWTHSSTGALPNGTNGYADTFLTLLAAGAFNNCHLSYYSRTNLLDTTTKIEIGMGGVGGSSFFNAYFGLYFSGSRYFGGSAGSRSADLINPATTTGLIINSATSNVLQKIYRNGISVANTTTTQTASAAAYNIFIGSQGALGNPTNYSNRQCAFASIGDGLTDTEAANLYTAVQAYQTTLSRNV